MLTKKVFAWGMYDLANTIYSALFVTFFFPILVVNYLHGTGFMVGAVFSLSMLLVALFVPGLGALSDLHRRRMPFVILFTILNCVAVALVPGANLLGALLLALGANFCYHAALNVYNALLPEVAEGAGLGRVSGIGVAMGYIGTFISLGVAYVVMSLIGWDTLEGVKAMFYTTALLFLGFAMFTFFWVNEKKRVSRHRSFQDTFQKVFSSISKGMKDIYCTRQLRSFMTAMFCFTNAMNAVIIFLFLYSQEAFGITIKAFFPAYAFFAFGAAGGSIIISYKIDKIGALKTLCLAGWMWIAVIILFLGLKFALGAGIDPYKIFLIAGTLGGAALGIVWTASRPLLIELAPKGKLAEYFGFLEMVSKFSGVIGPVLFGYLFTYHSEEWAILSLIAFFAVGLWSLRGVRVDYSK